MVKRQLRPQGTTADGIAVQTFPTHPFAGCALLRSRRDGAWAGAEISSKGSIQAQGAEHSLCSSTNLTGRRLIAIGDDAQVGFRPLHSAGRRILFSRVQGWRGWRSSYHADGGRPLDTQLLHLCCTVRNTRTQEGWVCFVNVYFSDAADGSTARLHVMRQKFQTV